MEKFGWCFIGYGGIAGTVAKTVLKGNHRIAAVYGRNFEKAQAFAGKFGATAYRTPEEALADPRVEGVYIATPNDSHGFYARLCIEHGKPVLVEKPFAMNREEAASVLALAEEKGIYAAEAMWTWHNPISQQVREWIRSGMIGQVKTVESRYSFPMLKKGDTTSRLVNPAAGGGAIPDIGIYPLRYTYELFGMPESIQAKGELYNGVDVDENVSMTYPGFTAKHYISFKKFKGEEMVITGTDGKIVVPYFHMAVKASLAGKVKQTIKNGGKMNFNAAYLPEFDDTAADIRSGKAQSSIVPHKATLDTMELLDSCRKQMGVVFLCEKENTPAKQLNTTIRAISHLGFNCKDLKKCQDFYCRVMGCQKQFELTYKDLAESVRIDAEAAGTPVPGYGQFFEKLGDRVWSVYLKWTDNCFIELFDQVGAFMKSVPGNHSLNYTHFSIEVENIRDFRQAVTDRGGAEYIDGEVTLGVDKTWQMWMHDPEGNKFELMEYTENSYQIKGRPSAHRVLLTNAELE